MNSFNPELQLKDIESAIRNKLKDLLNKLKEFRFMATLVLEFKKKKEVTTKTRYRHFTHPQRLKQLLMRATLVIYLNQSIVRLYQTNKNL